MAKANKYIGIIIGIGLLVFLIYSQSNQYLPTNQALTSGGTCIVDSDCGETINSCSGNSIQQERNYCSAGTCYQSIELVYTCGLGCEGGTCIQGNTTSCQSFSDIVFSRTISKTELDEAIVSWVGSN